MVLCRLFVLLGILSSAVATPEDVCREIYQKLERVIGDNRPLPDFKMLPAGNPRKNITAYFDPSANRIYMSLDLYQLARSFGKDSTNVLAFVLAHELTHFHQSHQQAFLSASPAENQAFLKNIQNEESRKAEEQGDYYGGLYSYLAGFSPFPVAEKFIVALYEASNLPDKTIGYPDKPTRLSILRKSYKAVERFIVLNETAQQLSVLRQYSAAARCLKEIASEAPTKDVWNNLGTLYALEAISYSDPGKQIFQYPFTFDQDSRFNRGGTKGTSDPELIRIKKFESARNNAIRSFEKSIQLDKKNAAAHLNLVLAQLLSGDASIIAGSSDELPLIISQARLYATRNKQLTLLAQADIAEGILLYYLNQKQQAAEKFNTAKSQLPWHSNFNLEVLKSTGYLKLWLEKQDAPSPQTPEHIGDADLEKMESIFDAMSDSVKTYELETEADGILMINVLIGKEYVLKTVCAKCDQESFPFIITTERYSGSSNLGIRRGDSYQKMLERYRTPDRMLSGNQIRLCIYESYGISFFINANNQVIGWMIF
jgi:tetratricopeptide (TPR) repeat protein